MCIGLIARRIHAMEIPLILEHTMVAAIIGCS